MNILEALTVDARTASRGRGPAMTFAAALLATSAGGCAPPAPAAAAATTTVQPDVVAIDVFAGEELTARCSGTMLSANVALTSAHCFEGGQKAFVSLPNAKRHTSAVSEVWLYDWTRGAGGVDHPREHDLALLVLESPAKKAKLAPVSKSDCVGCKVRQMHRTRVSALEAKVLSTKTLGVTGDELADRPFAMYVPSAASDAGGPMFRKDANGILRLAGVMIGTGERTRGGYAVRLSEPEVREWIERVLAERSPSSKSEGVSTTKTIRPLDGDFDYGGDLGGDWTGASSYPEEVYGNTDPWTTAPNDAYYGDPESAPRQDPGPAALEPTPPEATPPATPGSDAPRGSEPLPGDELVRGGTERLQTQRELAASDARDRAEMSRLMTQINDITFKTQKDLPRSQSRPGALDP